MIEKKRFILKIIAGLLDYPGQPKFWIHVQERAPLAEELDIRLAGVFKAFQQSVPIQLEQLYVAAFDFDAQGSLYLTTHELGDSRDRGQALIQLVELYRQAGYEVPEHQLADFLPMILELIAVRPELITPAFSERVAQVAGQIAKHLGPDHLYRPLFDLIQEALSHRRISLPLDVEENPDVADLPYPMEY